MGVGRRFGWHSGTMTCKDAKILGDLYVQDDIIFSDVSAGRLGITGGIDMDDTTSAVGIAMGGTYATAAIEIDTTNTTAIGINITGTGLTRGIMLGSFGTNLASSMTKNYYLGIYTDITTTISSGTTTIRGMIARMAVSVSNNANFGIYAAQLQTKITDASTQSGGGHLAGAWIYFETPASTVITIDKYCEALHARIDLDDSVTIHYDAAAIVAEGGSDTSFTHTAADYCGIIVRDAESTNDSEDFDIGLKINADCCTTAIKIEDCTTAINIDADDVKIKFGDGQDASISWKTTGFTQDALVIGLGTSKALVLMDEADVSTTTDVFDTALSNPGIVFVPATPGAGVYGFIRTYALGSDVHFVMKGSGDYAALILQPEDDSDNDTFFQWRCHEGAYPYLWENFTRGVVRSYNASPYTVFDIKDNETTLAVIKTGIGEDPVTTPCIVLGDNDSNSHCIGIAFDDDGSGQRRLKIFDEAGNNVYIDPTSTTLEAS